jgi:carboxylesterase
VTAVVTAFLLLLAAAVVCARAATQWHVRRTIRARSAHALDPDGIVAGARGFSLNVHTDHATERGVLLLHGFNDTPQSVADLARALHARGWSVVVPLLPGHGGTADRLRRDGSAKAWLEQARHEWDRLRARVRDPVLAGQSMGGALAAILAADAPPRALVMLAPYIVMSSRARIGAWLWWAWQIFIPELASDPRRSLRDPAARARSLGTGRFTPRLVNELRKVADVARAALPRVTVPALMIHARGDYRIGSRSARRTFDLLGARDKSLVWRDNIGHVVAADAGREEVFRIVCDWLEERVPAASADPSMGDVDSIRTVEPATRPAHRADISGD